MENYSKVKSAGKKKKKKTFHALEYNCPSTVAAKPEPSLTHFCLSAAITSYDE